MMQVDPFLLVGLFFAVLLLGVFAAWQISWVGRNKKDEGSAGISSLRRCPYCGHAFNEYLAKDIVVCPLCKSYLEVNNDSRQQNLS
jgi:hypothetical protein